MTRRKNTAEAFEILLRIAEEEKAKRKGKETPGVVPPRQAIPSQQQARVLFQQQARVLPQQQAPAAGRELGLPTSILPGERHFPPSFSPGGRIAEPLLGPASRDRPGRAAREPLPVDEEAGIPPESPTLPAGFSATPTSGRPAWHASRRPAGEQDLTQPPARVSRLGRWLGREPARALTKASAATGKTGKPAPAPKRGTAQGSSSRRSRPKEEKEEAAARKERALLLESEPVRTPAPVPVLAATPAADPHRLNLLEAKEPFLPPTPLRPSRSGPEVWDAEPGARAEGAGAGSSPPNRPPSPANRPRGRPGDGPAEPALPGGEDTSPDEALALEAAPPRTPERDPAPGLDLVPGDAGPAVAEEPESVEPAVPRPSYRTRQTRASSRWREGLVRAGEKVFGAAWPAILDRVVHLRVSTLLALLMAGVITIVLFLTYLKLPPQENPLVANFLESGARAGAGDASPAWDGGLTAEGPRLAASTAPPTPAASGGARRVLVRPVPLWSPGGGAVEGEAGSPHRGREPEIRNVEPAVPSPGDDGAAPSGLIAGSGTVASNAGEPAAAKPRSPYLYLIQVRAKESAEGAERILEYLGLLGFGDPRWEHKGDRHADGTKLYTVFVGSFDDPGEADRECERLKRETRRRPFRDRKDYGDFFADALVIRRARG